MQNNEEGTGESALPPRLAVAGIGASAGGLEALQEFFGALPPDPGLAYVVIAHLAAPQHAGLAALLGRCTPLKVVEVAVDARVALEPDCVYVIAPDCMVRMEESVIGATPFQEEHGHRKPIDTFLRSLAQSGADGFAVILSGGGTDGAAGAKAVKEAGGVVLVQDPAQAAHAGMPRAIIAARIADVVLPVRQLAARLVELALQKRRLAPLIAADAQAGLGADAEAALKNIFELLRVRTGHDFKRYKRSTTLRRLARRLQLNQCSSLDEYLSCLHASAQEIQGLFGDLLISVTGFFRDPAAWEALRTGVVVPLVERAGAHQSIRVWVPGCATGEEAYTLAMLFREEIERRELPCELVIFASDVDQGALITAREGIYPAAIAAEVSEARLSRHFRAEGDHYRIAAGIRDSVVFAVHSVLRDPSFSRLHLISCRNLLIYLERELQQQLQHLFRHALREDGYLFIGASETADAELFEPLDRQHRIFRVRQRPTAAPPPPQLPAMPPMAASGPVRARTSRPRRPAAEVHLQMLEELAPPSLLLDEHGNVAHLSRSAGRYLQPRGGAPTYLLADLVRPELVEELRTALHRALELQQSCLSASVPVRFEDGASLVAVLVQPRQHRGAAAEQQVLVTFLEGRRAQGAEGAEGAEGGHGMPDPAVPDLRQKLQLAEQRFESMRQEHRAAYEDLRAANEELQSLNEEYRFTAEELETSREELQSVNEQLQTANNELKMKLEEMFRANDDLENFMTATDIAVLFLDRSLCIKRYTAPVRRIFNLKAHDQGRPIADLTQSILYEDLVKDATQVLTDLIPVEKAVQERGGGWLIVRIRPYRTAQDTVEGIVVTFMK